MSLRDSSVAAPPSPAAAPHGTPATTARWRAYLRLARPHHWIKNGFVAAPAVFAGLTSDRTALPRVAGGIAAFCLASAIVYVFNDLHDVERDRTHPVKGRARPIASGAVSARGAATFAGALLVLLAGQLAAFPAAALPVGAYLALNAAYTLRLKHTPVVDLFCIASGFVLRVVAGAAVVAVPLSSWMMVTTLSLSLYLATLKRRQELALSGDESRAVLRAYSLPLLDGYAQTAASASIVFYGLYVAVVRPELALTLPLVLFGIFRYGYLVNRMGLGESPPDALWSDPWLLIVVVVWAGACVALI
jgi:decaprenyl-phosphate phosphoribosyltransferase